jgi:hypothetical protein
MNIRSGQGNSFNIQLGKFLLSHWGRNVQPCWECKNHADGINLREGAANELLFFAPYEAVSCFLETANYPRVNKIPVSFGVSEES